MISSVNAAVERNLLFRGFVAGVACPLPACASAPTCSEKKPDAFSLRKLIRLGMLAKKFIAGGLWSHDLRRINGRLGHIQVFAPACHLAGGYKSEVTFFEMNSFTKVAEDSLRSGWYFESDVFQLDELLALPNPGTPRFENFRGAFWSKVFFQHCAEGLVIFDFVRPVHDKKSPRRDHAKDVGGL